MFIVRTSYLLILLSVTIFNCIWARQLPFERIKGSNQKEMIEFVKQFPKENYQIYTVPGEGSFYLDDINDYIKGVLRSGKQWEPHIKELILTYAQPNSTVLDIGAHIGTHALAMSQQVGPKGRVLVFEPQPKIFRELFLNANLNQANNIYFYPVAVGNHKGSIELSPLRPGNEAGTSLIGGGEGKFVPLITIDSLKLDNVSLMKIDVEAQEDLVLEGARKTIRRCRPVIIIEIRGEYRLESAPPDVKNQILYTISQLEKMGYSVSYLGQAADYLALPIQDKQ